MTHTRPRPVIAVPMDCGCGPCEANLPAGWILTGPPETDDVGGETA